MTEQVTPTGQWGWSGCGEGTETEGCRAAAEGTQVALGVGVGVSEGGGRVFSLRTHCTVLHDNLKHSIMTPFCQFYLSLTFQPLSHTLEAPRSEVLHSLPLGWRHARQFHKVSLSVGTLFWCISFATQPKSNSKKKQPPTETRAIISTVVHAHTKFWSWRDKPVIHAHWHLEVTHRNMNSSLDWGGVQKVAQSSNSSPSPGCMFTQRCDS